MPEREPQRAQTEKDRLVARPGDPLPAPLDPGGAPARGAPADPKPKPEPGQGTDPRAGELDHSA